MVAQQTLTLEVDGSSPSAPANASKVRQPWRASPESLAYLADMAAFINERDERWRRSGFDPSDITDALTKSTLATFFEMNAVNGQLTPDNQT